jgi:NADPH:quinone reductase-like Zn-dependent oxidoreductase
VAGLGADVRPPVDFEAEGPFDVNLELVGAPNLAEDLRALATNGRIALIGMGAGSRADIDLGMLLARRATVRGSTLRARPLEEKALVARRVEASVLPLLASGRIRVPVAATFPLADAAQAYERFRGGGKLGKVVLVMEG